MTGLIEERGFAPANFWMYESLDFFIFFIVHRGRILFPVWRALENPCNVLTDFTLPQDEHRIFVESEDEPNRVLLETKITKDDGYQKQQGSVFLSFAYLSSIC